MDFLANPIINILIIYILYITYLYIERNWNTKVLPVFCSVWSCPLTAGPRIYQLPTCLSVSILPTWPIEAVQGDQAMQRKEFVKLTELGQQFISVQFGHSVVSDSLWPHEPQHARPPCPSPTPRVYPKSCPLSRWCHPTISSSVVPFSPCPQSFPASGSFPMSQLFAWGGQSIRVSASTSVLPMNTQDWSPLEWTGWISLQSKGLSRVFSNTTVQKHQFFCARLSL